MPDMEGKPKGRAVILGVNQRIKTLIDLLKEQNREVLVVSEHIRKYREELEGVDTLQGDFIDHKNLKRANLQSAETVIILAETIGHKPHDADARSVVATLSVEQMHPEARTVVEALSEDTAYHLRNAGVDEIIVSGELTADILAFSTNHSNYSTHLSILLRFAHRNRIVTAAVKDRLVKKTFAEAGLILAKERKILLGARRRGTSRTQDESTDPTRVLQSTDEIVYIDIL